MDQKMDYVLLHEDMLDLYEALNGLQEKVKKHISFGYVPQGGVSICAVGDNNYHHYSAAQAMVRVNK